VGEGELEAKSEKRGVVGMGQEKNEGKEEIRKKLERVKRNK
jgi:hypothetical protein